MRVTSVGKRESVVAELRKDERAQAICLAGMIGGGGEAAARERVFAGRDTRQDSSRASCASCRWQELVLGESGNNGTRPGSL